MTNFRIFALTALVLTFSPQAWSQEMPAPSTQPLQPLTTQEQSVAPAWNDTTPAWKWNGGAGAYFFALLGSNAAFSTNSFSRGSGNLSGTSQQTNFPTHVDAAPLVFLGFTTPDGWGLRGQWYEFSQNNSAGTTMDGTSSVSTAGGRGQGIPSQGSIVTASSGISFSVIDLEGTYSFVLGKTSLLTSAGLRYAHLSQTYQFSVADATNGNSQLSSNHNFNGIGLTMGFDAHRPLGDTPFGMYGKGRLSVLFGPSSQDDVNSQQGNIFSFGRNDHIGESGLLTMFELEVGGEWHQTWGRFGLFAQAGFAAQYWLDFNSPGPNTEASLQGYSANTLMFIGGVARIGITF